ncbi:MAG TPA: Crp/Fnr family transcriptional regulator [Ramlibacter sp.]|nr:Crp/Fnr family transcriptional regulator [Ramlibacter sp.]
MFGAASAEPSFLLAQQNLLVASLPQATLARWAPEMDRVDLSLGQSLYEPGTFLTHAYFPVTALVSLLYVMVSGASTEIAVVGNDGILGVSLFMGGGSTPSRAVVQSAGTALRLPVDALTQEFARGGVAANLLLRYTQALITQMTQTAACNRHHAIDQQLCRWLLISLDRIPGDELVMTQELISNMLGVRREGVTEAASRLQRRGLIRYSRGRIRVLDRQGVEASACECYDVVRKEYKRLLPEFTAR